MWLSAESLGDDDPALAAGPDLPAVFVFDEPLLARLRLSGKRLVFLAQTLADLAARRPVEVRLGVVADELSPDDGWPARMPRCPGGNGSRLGSTWCRHTPGPGSSAPPPPH